MIPIEVVQTRIQFWADRLNKCLGLEWDNALSRSGNPSLVYQGPAFTENEFCDTSHYEGQTEVGLITN